MSKNQKANREVISLHIGQAGIQLGSCVWHQYCKEHRIALNGVMLSKKIRMQEKLRKNSQGELEPVPQEEVKEEVEPKEDQKKHYKRSEFEEAATYYQYVDGADRFVPRAICVDLEPNVLDSLENSSFGTLFNPKSLIRGKEDAANNYARGRYTVGKSQSDKVIERLRQEWEKADHVQSIMTTNAVGGGTGSGFTSLILEYIASNYKKVPLLSYCIYPSVNLSTCVVEPYNALLATQNLIEYNHMTTVIDNEQGYHLCQKFLHVDHPSYYNMNVVIAKAISCVTSGVRFGGQQSLTVSDLLTNLVPFPKLHFMTTSIAPIIDENNPNYDKCGEESITTEAFDHNNFFVKYQGWDIEEDKWMGISLIYRGNSSVKDVNKAVQFVKSNKIRLVEWCPTGFKLSMIDKQWGVLKTDKMLATERSVCMYGNNTAISRPFEKRIAKKYDLLYSQRAFVHWFVGEGMEEGEFAEAREELGFLLQDFEDMKKGDNSDNIQDGNDDDDDDQDEQNQDQQGNDE